MQRGPRKSTKQRKTAEVPVESTPIVALSESAPAIQPEPAITPETIIPVSEMGVIQLHHLIRSWSGTPRYAKYSHLLDLCNRAELQKKVAEAIELS